MIKLIEEQNADMKLKLYDIPALFTLYAMNHNGHLSDKEEKKALEILHVETYSGHPELKAYFHEVEVNFLRRLHMYDEQLSVNNEKRHDEIKEILHSTQPFFENLDKKKLDNFATAINTFVGEVVRSNKHILSDFAMPIFTQYLEKVNKILFREVVGLPKKN